MKALLVALLLTIPCLAADIPLAWDVPLASDGLSGYFLYAATNAITATNFHSAQIRLPIPLTNGVVLTSIKPGTYWFTVTAVQTNTLESDPSNILVAQVPNPPPNLRTVTLQYSNTLTNWQDTGYFRVKIGLP